MFKVLVPEEEGGPKLYYVKPWQSLGPGRDSGLHILWAPVLDFPLPAPAPSTGSQERAGAGEESQDQASGQAGASFLGPCHLTGTKEMQVRPRIRFTWPVRAAASGSRGHQGGGSPE